MPAKAAPNQRIDLVKATVALYIVGNQFVSCALTKGGVKMVAPANKPRPAHVPAENVYEKTHWLLIVTYLVAALALYLLISNAG